MAKNENIKVTPNSAAQKDEFFRNFEWGPFQENVETNPVAPVSRKDQAPIRLPSRPASDDFEWDAFRVGSEDQRG